MAQARGNGSTRAVDSLSDSNEVTLGENQRIFERDGGIFLQTTMQMGDRERVTERRVDSEGDLDHQAKGGKLWWQRLMREQKLHDEAEKKLHDEAEKKPVRKPKGKSGEAE